MNLADHFDGCSFIYEDDRTTITNGHAVDLEGRPAPRGPAKGECEAPSPADQHENIRAWLSGVVVADEGDKPLVADVFYALGGLSNADPAAGGQARTREGGGGGGVGVGRANVKVHTMGPGFVGRAPPFASSEFFANAVVVAILLLFAPGFTILAAGVFVTSRVAERWAGQDQ
ncbi:hypothetical protein ColKHC_06397 [Colletotrichum higginsianum]|uniref:Uncharacterized protein n=1 Tax=Colletotrichum higginsianum TaxID=80884 RepID=A0A4T0VUU7_9PEZI|nr:hypothetical protein CH35J_008934 [Colletotrichum higginsianum]GJC97571.1 hypothetical protein ColKHC_06397 [Colletotrichum higginsianum]